MSHVDKVIVTNVAALKVKYKGGFKAIAAAIDRLIAADAKRGLTTKLVALDNDAAMKRFGALAVTSADSPKQNKDAVDAVSAGLTPDYLVVLGAIDVVPHQDLTNPVKDDDDPIVWGDLPYACAAPYSKRVEDFRSPTRVVGRVPDITAGSDAKYLADILDAAAKYTSSARSVYETYLGMTAEVWAQSTKLSLDNTFGASTALQQVPPRNEKWSPALLKTRSHFINCHGAPGDSHFYGQRGSKYPIAHDAAYLTRRVTAGTVVSAECCYGAELYDPSVAGGQMGICNTYLGGGAYGFFGSSTTAYGPSAGNGSADLICQYFLQRMLAGSSLGRAALEARQHFVQTMSVLDPSDLKTLAQFSLMGDPSVHPVASELPALTHTKAYRAALPEGDRTNRELRRERLTNFGLAIGSASGAARHSKKLRPRPKVREALEAAARETGLKDLSFASYVVHHQAGRALGKALRPAPSAFHVAVGRHPTDNHPVIPVVLIIATEIDGHIVRLRRLHAR